MIPAALLDPPPEVASRYSAERRAYALRSLGRMPETWRVPLVPLARKVPNVLLALKEWVDDEERETRADLKRLARQTTARRAHLARLKKAKAVGED